jgi:hypothetical protein
MVHSFLKVKYFFSTSAFNLRGRGSGHQGFRAGLDLSPHKGGFTEKEERQNFQIVLKIVISYRSNLAILRYELQFFLDIINVLYYIVLQFIEERIPLAQKKVARTIYIKDEQLEALKRLSQKTKVPQSVYVREALDMLLEKYSEQLKFEFKEYFKE